MNNSSTQHTTDQRARVAWLDDDISNYRHWIAALEDEGVIVQPYTNQTQLLNALKNNRFDLIIVDERLKNGMGSKLVVQFHRKCPSAAFLFLSGFFIEEDLREKLRDIQEESSDIKLFAIEKNSVPDVKSDDFHLMFVQEVLKIVAGAPVKFSEIAVHAKSEMTDSPFNVSFSDYRDMGEDERFRLSEDFLNSRETEILGYFDDKAIWICFFGDSEMPDIVATTKEDIPTIARLDSIAADKGLAPFCFASPQRIESISAPTQGSSLCSASSGLKGYNHLHYEVGGHRLYSHFDSGAWEVFLNSRMLAERNLIREGVSHTTMPTSLGVFFGQHERVGFLVDLIDGDTIHLDHIVFAVRNFETSKLAARCLADCADGPQPICTWRRAGLFGRSLFVENGLRWQTVENYAIVVERI